MPYSPTTWIDNSPPAIDASHLNKIETELARLKVNADLDAAAAIAYSKLNLAASIARTDMAAGFKTTVGAMASGPPASPTTNDVWIATDVDSNGTCWQFRYNSAETTYKWEFIGGGWLRSQITTTESTASAVLVDLTTTGPSITLPRAGDYLFHVGARTNNSVASSQNVISLCINAGGSVKDYVATTPAAGTEEVAGGQWVLTGFAANDVVKMRYRVGGGTCSYIDRFLFAQPVRII